MQRRRALLAATVGIMVAIAAIGQQKPTAQSLLVLDWAKKAKEAAPPTAIVIEMGLKDAQAKPWSGKAVVSGAKVVHREGYRFREGDKLTEPDGWVASSHRPLRAPPKSPAIVAVEPVATVGVVLHLTDIQPDAALRLSVPDHEIKDLQVSLKEILSGQAKALEGGRLSVRLVSTATPVATAKTEDDFPAACYGPDGTLWVAWIGYHVQEDNRRIEPPQLKGQPKDFKAYQTSEFGDQLFVKSFKDGKWSDAIAITDAKQDLVRCAIAAEGDGTVWAVYSANRQGKFHLFATPIRPAAKPDDQGPTVWRPGREERLTTAEASDLHASVTNISHNRLLLAYQHWRLDQGPCIQFLGCEKGKWSESVREPGGGEMAGNSIGGRAWNPVAASGPGEHYAVVHDEYLGSNYELGGAVISAPGSRALGWSVVDSAGRFNARPAICYDLQSRLWVAYEEGPELWGKDFGALDADDGNPLYFSRTIKVVCLEDGKLKRPVAELPSLPPRVGSPDTGAKVEALPRYAYPKIGIDGKGRVWVTYRQKFGTRYSSHPGSYWLTMARRLDGDQWSPPIEVAHSDGLLDDRPVLLPHPAGGLRIIHNTDGRYSKPEVIDNQIYMSYLDLPGDPVEPKLVAHDAGKKDEKLVARAKKEKEAVQRIRDYRLEAGGKKYQLLRGEFHRHTEISWDGGPDGSLEDMFRYGIDAAGMDWIGNGDHDSGAGREYCWWLIQKYTDAFHVPNRFTPMFTYERSVSYPHGHRNCMFAQRGVRTLPRLAEPDKEKAVAGIHADDTKMLYRYLKELNGICASHTSATGMGTDWRDHDPQVEPFVEIYQGDRNNYEFQGAPRAGYDPKGNMKPFSIGGWQPKGFVNLPLLEGRRLGFQASSDHFSTHISYCVVLAEKHDRQGILDACRKRHCYGATDDIILDVRSGTQIMGDEFKTKEAPKFEIKVIGTAPLAKVTILKNSEPAVAFDGMKGAEFQTAWTDPKPTAGTHYYYVRVEQADGELAWSSPMWIDCTK
jgi:hypothetical protein